MTIDDDSPTEAETSRPDEPTGKSKRVRAWRWIRRGLSKWRPIVLTALVVAAMGLAASVYYLQYRPEQQTDTAAADSVKKAAEDGAVALLSYTPENLTGDIAKAKSHLTGDFLTYYTQFTEQIAASAATQKQIMSTAAVVRAGVAELKPDSAVVLLFINKQSLSKDNPAPVFTPATVRVSLTKVKESWLIGKFEPL